MMPGARCIRWNRKALSLPKLSLLPKLQAEKRRLWGYTTSEMR